MRVKAHASAMTMPTSRLPRARPTKRSATRGSVAQPKLCPENWARERKSTMATARAWMGMRQSFK